MSADRNASLPLQPMVGCWRACALRVLSALILICASGTALAQVPGSVLPGREREQIAPPQAPRPQAQPGRSPIALPGSVAPPGAATTTLVLRRIVVTGSTIYSAEDLAPLYQNLIGQRVTLQAVYDVAQAITAKYGTDGYVLTRAIVPPQELNPGGAVIRIEVVEGWIDAVEWPREKLARYRDFFTYYTARITGERPINIRTLERYLLLGNDLPGLKFTTSLTASKKHRGASTLVVEVTEKRLDVLARLDNRGTIARGPVQYLIAPTLNNALGWHEALTFVYAGVWKPRELQFVAPSYRQVLTPEGLTAFINASYSWGRPGTPLLEELNYRTRGTYIEGGLSYPIIRSRERNLSAAVLMFVSDNISYITADSLPLNKDRLRGVRARLEGDRADGLNGINQFTLTFSQGIQGLGSTPNDNPDASRPPFPAFGFPGGRVDFTKIELYVTRTQQLPARFSAFIAGYGQYAGTPLLVPEQCSYGGRFFGRAFDPSEILGDHCLMGLFELRYDVAGLPALLSGVQLYAYTDKGWRYNRDAVVGTAATVTGASAGAGVRLGWLNYFNVDLSAAKAIEGPRNDWRFFFIATARN